jgi:antitoxin (DNA-binding transcriptional repressor) of toxin-antitoxin stability system
MSTATIRDLRTHFPRVRLLLEQEGEVIVTDHGRPVAVLRAFDEPLASVEVVDYYARLRQRMPKAISKTARHALDETRAPRWTI